MSWISHFWKGFMHTAYRLTGGLTSISEASAVFSNHLGRGHIKRRLMWSSFVQVPPITLPKTNVAPNDPSFLEFSIFLSFETLLVSGRLSIFILYHSKQVNSINIKHVTNEVHRLTEGSPNVCAAWSWITSRWPLSNVHGLDWPPTELAVNDAGCSSWISMGRCEPTKQRTVFTLRCWHVFLLFGHLEIPIIRENNGWGKRNQILDMCTLKACYS